MAEFIPPLNSCLKRMTSGERRFARRVDALLEDDYLCWYDLPVGNKRRYPDFVLLHPARGILLIEVKDWKAESIKRVNKLDVDLLTDAGMKTVSNPIEQVRQCSYQVLQLLEKDPQLQNSSGKFKGKLCFPYGYGVAFTNITRKKFKESIPEEYLEILLPDHLIISKDEMASSVTAEDFQKQLWDMFHYQYGDKLTLPQINRIRYHLFPEIRINFFQEKLFDQTDLEKSQDSVSDTIPEIIKVMDVKQEKLARSMGEGHRVVHGVSGSGKTLILGFRCLYLAEIMQKPILVLCFNITLATSIRSFISERGIGGKVQVYHFHDWCKEQLRMYHIDVIEDERPYYERQVDTVIQAVDKGEIPRAQYGALLIDEGHDFEADWLRLIVQMVEPSTNSLLLLYDDAQSIYSRKSTLNFSLASVGIQAQGRTTILNLNYRNTREILDFAYRFAKGYMKDKGNEDIPLIQPEAAGISGKSPVIKQLDSMNDEIEYVLRCLNNWKKRGKLWNDIAVIYPGGIVGKLMSEALEKEGIPCTWLSESKAKKKYNKHQNQVALMPIPSSKGLEFDAVIMIDSSFSHLYLKNNKNETDQIHTKEIEADIRRLYVGFTRAKKYLLISYHKKNEISKALKAVGIDKNSAAIIE